MTVQVRRMEEGDLDEADRVMRLAFGTEFRLPDPLSFAGDVDLIRPRWRADRTACFVAQADGEIVGSAIVAFWGSLAVVGPVTVRPDRWNAGVARTLVPAVLDAADHAGAAVVALYTHPSSPRHLRLYESFGFASRRLIAVMSRPVDPAVAQPAPFLLGRSAPDEAVTACARLADRTFPGLDLTGPIRATASQRLGDTVLLHREGVLAGFAVCHTGPGSEAGSGVLGVNFAVAEPGALEDLVAATEAYAALRGASTVELSANLGRRAAYATLKDRGYRTQMTGVAMLRPDIGDYDGPDVPILEEWR